MAVIRTNSPTFYLAGAQVSPPTVVGRSASYNYVARYQFTVPSGVAAYTIAANLGIATYNNGNISSQIRYKVTTSPTSHVNAGAGSSYDGKITFDVSRYPRYNALIINGQVSITQAGTYYLYIFPGTTDVITWSWPIDAIDLNLTERRYYVYFNADGGENPPPTLTRIHGQTAYIPTQTPTKTGYTFLGWAYAPNTAVVYNAGDAYTEDRDRTLYAVWQPLTYSVTYSANGGSDAPAPQTKTHGVALTLSTQIPTRAHYQFMGWAITEDGQAIYQAGAEYTDNADLALFAVWNYTPTYRWRASEIESKSNTSDTIVRALWAGYVNGREVLCVACNGFLWELSENNGEWTKTSCGILDTSGKVCLFGFGEKLWAISETEYKVWNGTSLSSVAGYIPLIMVSCLANGTGEELEGINRLTGKRRINVSPDGTSTVYKLPELADSVDNIKDLTTNTDIVGWTYMAGEVTFSSAPSQGTNSIQITYDMGSSDRSIIIGMKLAELYHSQSGPCVFLGGDGSNRLIYSALDEAGTPRADYFPEFNEALVGDANTPITSILRQGTKLICFKEDSAYTVGSYNSITLDNGRIIGTFTVKPLNRDIGCATLGAGVLVENAPITPDGKSLIAWNLSDYMQEQDKTAEVISERIAETLKTFDFNSLGAYYDKREREYYLFDGSHKALVLGVAPNAWTLYTNFPAVCMVSYKDELYIGTADGTLSHLSEDYLSDNGAAIPARWESGAMAFSKEFERKYSAMLWIALEPEDTGYIDVTAKTDVKDEFASYPVDAPLTGELPHVIRLKLKAKKFTFYKLILTNDKAGKSATVVSASVRVRGTGYAR